MLGLRVPQLGILALCIRQKCFVAALLDDLPVVENHYIVAEAARR
jgi:hypothetical protein